MVINRNNYEQYLVDYSEGHLSEMMQAQVESFLLVNPDIQEEFEQFTNLELDMNPVKIESNQDLKNIPMHHTTEQSSYFQELCIGHLEKTNKPEEDELLSKLISNDAKKKHTFDLYQSTKLKSEPITFNEKLLAKKTSKTHQVTLGNFEEYCVASCENWLDINGSHALNDFLIQNPEQQVSYRLYQSIVFKPDERLVFPHKEKLKKFHLWSDRSRKVLAYISGVAAILVLSLMLFNVQEIENKNQLITQINQPTNEQKDILLPPEESGINTAPNNLKEKQLLTKAKQQDLAIVNQESNKLHGNIKIESIPSIESIKIFQIECPKCLSYNERGKFFKTTIQHTSIADLGSQISAEAPINSNDELAWKIAQASIIGINKFTNAEIALQKKRTSEKRRIAFNSKYFSFSAPIKKSNP